jgi:hypothetical protein
MVRICAQRWGLAQAEKLKTTRRPSDTKIQFYCSEASTNKACAKPGVGCSAIFHQGEKSENFMKFILSRLKVNG